MTLFLLPTQTEWNMDINTVIVKADAEVASQTEVA